MSLKLVFEGTMQVMESVKAAIDYNHPDIDAEVECEKDYEKGKCTITIKMRELRMKEVTDAEV